MKLKFIVINFIICFLVIENAVASPLSPKAESVYAAYSSLKIDCRSKSYQDKYLTVFPQKADEFVKLFNPEDFGELYNWSDEYIFILKCILKDQPDRVIKIVLSIAKDIPHSSDAPNYLDDVVIDACQETPLVFIKTVRTFNAIEIRRIVNLLADHEAIKLDPDYQKCIDILKANKAEDIAKIFEEERLSRINQSDNHL